MNVYAALAARFPADRGRVFVIGSDGRRYTYAELDATTAGMAAVLRHHGVAPGDRIAGLLDKSPEALLLYLASCRVGAVYVPIHIDLTAAEVGYILGDATPKLVVCRPGLEAMVAAETVLTLDASGGGSLMASVAGDGAAACGTPDDANAIVYTSGTTGKPKGAILTNGLVVWNAIALAERWRMTQDDVLLHANPLAFGLFGTTTPVLAVGAGMRLLPKFEASAVVVALPGVTMFSGVPTYYSRLMAHPGFTAETCRGMRLFITGSAPMRGDLFAAFTARTGHVLLDRYGLTEALIVASMPADGDRRPDISGQPLDGSMMRLVDPAGTAVEPGAVGAIELWQPHLFRGYWQAPEKTEAAFTADGWFITGDFGRIDEAGALTVLGRGVDLIITGGFNVYPKEVETALNALPNVAESAVIGVPHGDFGEAVVAVVELTDATAGFSVSGAQLALSAELSRYKIPKHVEVVASLPRNTLGKIQKAALKQRMLGLFGDVR